MRLFLAIGLPDNVRRFVGGLQEQLRKSIVGPARWVPLENLHFTLKFLGDVPDDKLDSVRAAFASIEGDSFDLQFSALAQLPPDGRADVVCIDIAHIPAALHSLVNHIETTCESIGFPRETRPYHPHLTLVRLSVPRFVSREIEMPIVPAKFRVDEIALMQSTLTTAGSTYQVIERRELALA